MSLPESAASAETEIALLRRRLLRERRARQEAEEIAERSTRELYEREQSFRALFADNPFPMWVYDRETLRILEVNSAAIENYGYPREEFLSLTIEDIRPDEDIDRLRADLAAERPPLHRAGAWRHRLKTGRIIDVEIVSHTLRFAERDAVLVLAQDITSRNELEAAKSAFLTAVSHELRTPLTSLLGFARTLEAHDAELSDELRRECVEHISASALKLDHLVADLLDVDRLTRGVLVARRQPTDVGALIHRLVAELDSARPVHVNASTLVAAVDPGMVERIVENLLSNAVTHTPSGTQIWITALAQPDGTLICIDDDGPGVPEERRASIFHVFQHGSVARVHAPGMGIGLALVAHFAALHQGRAWVEERRGGGAAVRVFLAGRPSGGSGPSTL
jgi:PAS domain S-box-containing protein